MKLDDDTRRRILMDCVPEDGSYVGNTALLRNLGWPEETYWSIRDGLIEAGALERGRGRGGSVRRVTPVGAGEAAGTLDEPTPESIGKAYEKELELYQPMRDVIASGKIRSKPLAVETTAMQGRRSTGGRWSRPDIVAVAVRTYQFVPGKFIEVATYEVKPAEYVDVTAVYEALSHLRSATHAYVLFHVPDFSEAARQDAVEDIGKVARAHGIGVMVAVDPADWTTWDPIEEAVRREPDPELLEKFISSQLSPETQAMIARALR